MKTQHIVIRRVLTALMCFASALFASLSPMEDAAAAGFGYYTGDLGWVIYSGYPTSAEAETAAIAACEGSFVSSGSDCTDTSGPKADLDDDRPRIASTFSDGEFFVGSRFLIGGVDPRYGVIGIGATEALAIDNAVENCVAAFSNIVQGSETGLDVAACTTAIMANRDRVCKDGVLTDFCLGILPACPGEQARDPNDASNTCMLTCPANPDGSAFFIENPLTRTVCDLDCPAQGLTDIGEDQCVLVCNAIGQTENGDRNACECRTDDDFVASGTFADAADPLVCTLTCPGLEEPNSAISECRCDRDSGNVRPAEGPDAGICVVAEVCTSPLFDLDRTTNMCTQCKSANLTIDGVCQVPLFCSGPLYELDRTTNMCDQCILPTNLEINGVCQLKKVCTDPLLSELDMSDNVCKIDSCPMEGEINIGGKCEVEITPSDCDGDLRLNSEINKCVCPSPKADVGNDMCECPAGTTEEEGGGLCEADAAESTLTTTPLPLIKEGDEGIAAGVFGGGMLAVVAMYHFGGGAGVFLFSPDYGYSLTESGYSYNYGGRVNYKNANWNIYWTAAQANANGNSEELHYSSGGSYQKDFWTAAFSENVQGDKVDYDFSLKAEVASGIWKLSPVYKVHASIYEGKSETDSALNLEAVLQWNRWKVRPSAGFRWENVDDFGDKARFGVRAVREF